MNSKQARALTRLVQHNFLVSLHSITNDYVFASIAHCDISFADAIRTLCDVKTDVSLAPTGDRLSVFIFKH